MNWFGMGVSVLQVAASAFELSKGEWRQAGVWGFIAIANGFLAWGPR